MKWRELPQLGDVPKSRSSHGVSCVDDGKKLVLWGGEHAPRVPVPTDTYIYSIETGHWSSLAASEAPPPRVAHAQAAIGNTVFVHGGRREVAEDSALGDLHAFDVMTGRWSELSATGTTPCARNYHAACSGGNALYVFGGCGSAGRLADLWRYDCSSGKWEELPSSDAIKGRGGAGFVAGQSNLWVIGGFTGKESSDIHRFDLIAGAWHQVEASSSNEREFTARSVFGRGFHSCTASGCGFSESIFVFGGEIDPSDLGHAGAGQFCNETFCLDTSTCTWRLLAGKGDAPVARGWMASTDLPGRGMIISGGVDDANGRLGDLHFLDVHDN